MIVGYKLVEVNTGAEIKTWGGKWGECPGVPSPLYLPNGDIVHGASLDADYNGYKLVEWEMADPGPIVPVSVTPRQVRLLLLSQNLLDQVEEMIASQDRATQITWEFAVEFRRDDPLLLSLAGNLGLTDEQLDAFFIQAAAL